MYANRVHVPKQVCKCIRAKVLFLKSELHTNIMRVLLLQHRKTVHTHTHTNTHVHINKFKVQSPAGIQKINGIKDKNISGKNPPSPFHLAALICTKHRLNCFRISTTVKTDIYIANHTGCAIYVMSYFITSMIVNTTDLISRCSVILL